MEKFVFVGVWLNGSIWCPQNKIASVRAAYDNIERGDLSPGVLDEVFAAGGTLVEDSKGVMVECFGCGEVINLISEKWEIIKDVFVDSFCCEDCMFVD